jgi:isoamylase
MDKLEETTNRLKAQAENGRAAVRTLRGRPMPLGVSNAAEGLNLALLCRHGTQVWLDIFPLDGGDAPLAQIRLHPRFNRTGDHWHVQVIGLPAAGFRYGWRVDGPSGDGHRYDPKCVLLDPASPMLSGGAVWGRGVEENRACTGRRSVYFRGPRYDWGDDAPPLVPLEDSVVYEMHVRGFTAHPSAGVSRPGTFAGLTEKIPYLQWLGVTAVELLPIHEFDETDCPFTNPVSGERNRNFWGYNSIAFAAPKAAFAATGAEHGQVAEFRDMVKAFHAAGIEVWLDVVFNHTGEGDERGRTYSFRGLDNSLYYLLTPDGRYLNFTGCGNTLNCNHPVVRNLILTCLRFWVGDMHVDGLRFDLASILGRDQKGNVLVEPPIIEMIAEDGVLADTKLIAEPWDAAGLYQVGGFPFGRRWSEWNGRYRDDVRRFWKGLHDSVGPLATRLTGSSDLYEWNSRLPRHSVNYVTCHDGFTLHDLVSYERKHNHANGEENRDGYDDNNSWNCGAEGETDDPQVLGLRRRQAKNLMATLLLSQGVPMLLAGDEFLRTQRGNNNAWCQDNEISWLDWSLRERNADFLRFVREFIHLRKRHSALRRKRFFRGEIVKRRPGAAANGPAPAAFPTAGPVRPAEAGLPDGTREAPELPRLDGLADIVWHGKDPRKPDWSSGSRIIAFTLDGRFNGREIDPDYAPDNDFYVAINGSGDPVPFRVPPSPTKRKWRRVVDTALAPPLDIVAEEEGPHVADNSRYIVAPLAVVVLISE